MIVYIFQNCTILDTASEGKCCRDPNYKDPWPSANLANGVDSGQYKEDNTLGQYFPDKLRNVRSGVFPNQRKKLETQTSCGIRNYVSFIILQLLLKHPILYLQRFSGLIVVILKDHKICTILSEPACIAQLEKEPCIAISFAKIKFRY